MASTSRKPIPFSGKKKPQKAVFSHQDDDLFRCIQEHINPDYNQWMRAPVARGPEVIGPSISKEKARRLRDKEKLEQQDQLKDRIRMLELRVTTRKQSLETCKQREQYLINSNNSLVKMIEDREKETATKVNDNLRSYEKCRIGACNLGHLFDTQKAECEETLQTLNENLSDKIAAMEKWLTEYDVLVQTQQTQLYDLQCYKDKEYHIKLMKIADLEKSIKELDTNNEDDYEDMEQIMEQELQKFAEELHVQQRTAYIACSGKALQRVHPSVQQMGFDNGDLQQEITVQKKAIIRLKKKIKDLEQEVTRLRRPQSRDFRTIVFPELSSRPKCEPDTDLRIDIPQQRWLPI